MKFLYKIGESTKNGEIIARYYMEWKNRNGGDQNGYFYVFSDGSSLNESLIKK